MSIQAPFTWSDPVETFSSPPFTLHDSPVVWFNSSDERASSPDSNFWSIDDFNDEPMTMGLWVNLSDTRSNTLLSKWASAEWEWTFNTVSNGTLRFRTWDISTGKGPQVIMDSPIVANTWLFLVFTYDGRGGDTAASGMTIYVNGIIPPQTQINTPGYSAMQNGSKPIEIGSASGGSGGFGAMRMAGGATGPFFTQTVLTPGDIQSLYALGQDSLGLN